MKVDGPKMANMIEYGKTPILPPRKLEEMGYQIIVCKFEVSSMPEPWTL